MTQGLGPELSADEDVASRLVAVWRALAKWPSGEVQRQCVKFVELVALFHPGKFGTDPELARQALGLVRLHLAQGSPHTTAGTVFCALRLAERDVEGLGASPELRRGLFGCLERGSRAWPPTSLVALSPSAASWALRVAWARAEMQGAAGPHRVVQPDRFALYYPPDLEEQVCHVAVEMVKGSRALGDWFTFCRDVIAGGGETQPEPGDAAGAAGEEPGAVRAALPGGARRGEGTDAARRTPPYCRPRARPRRLRRARRHCTWLCCVSRAGRRAQWRWGA